MITQRTRWALIAGIGLATGLAGCSSPKVVTVRINSDPVGAEVWVNGEKVGTTERAVELTYGDDMSEQEYCIQLRMPGKLPLFEVWNYREAEMLKAKTFKFTEDDK